MELLLLSYGVHQVLSMAYSCIPMGLLVIQKVGYTLKTVLITEYTQLQKKVYTLSFGG